MNVINVVQQMCNNDASLVERIMSAPDPQLRYVPIGWQTTKKVAEGIKFFRDGLHPSNIPLEDLEELGEKVERAYDGIMNIENETDIFSKLNAKEFAEAGAQYLNQAKAWHEPDKEDLILAFRYFSEAAVYNPASNEANKGLFEVSKMLYHLSSNIDDKKFFDNVLADISERLDTAKVARIAAPVAADTTAAYAER